MSVGAPAWAAFVAFIVAMLLVDLLVLHRKAHEVSMRGAAAWTESGTSNSSHVNSNELPTP